MWNTVNTSHTKNTLMLCITVLYSPAFGLETPERFTCNMQIILINLSTLTGLFSPAEFTRSTWALLLMSCHTAFPFLLSYVFLLISLFVCLLIFMDFNEIKSTAISFPLRQNPVLYWNPCTQMLLLYMWDLYHTSSIQDCSALNIYLY